MTEARALVDGVRKMAVELSDMQRCREELFASVAGAKSPKTRDPGMSVQFSRDTSDHMADVVAELADLDKEINQVREILNADRARLRAMLRKIKNRDERKILRLYYLSPFKIIREGKAERRELRTWFDIEEILGLTRDPVMIRRRKLIQDLDRLISTGM